jgi:hypothetical protein
MYELRVALVTEGPTDAVVIEAALKALLPRPFVLTQLQPEPTRPKLGGGWGGVLRWCLDFAKGGHDRFEQDPTLPGFDLFVVHIDADVAEKEYTDVGIEIADLARQRGWPQLPNVIRCPPPSGSAEAMRTCLLAWAGLREPGPRTVLCVPSKAVEAWLTAATVDEDHPLLDGLECNFAVEARLKALPIAQRIKKTSRDYRARERTLTENWPAVRQRCTQAERFSTELAAALA